MSVSEYLKFKIEAKESVYQAIYSESINTPWKLQVSTPDSHIVAYYRSIHKKKIHVVHIVPKKTPIETIQLRRD